MDKDTARQLIDESKLVEDIRAFNPIDFDKKWILRDEDALHMIKLIKSDNYEDAIRYYVKNYMNGMNTEYYDLMTETLTAASRYEFNQRNLSTATTNIALNTNRIKEESTSTATILLGAYALSKLSAEKGIKASKKTINKVRDVNAYQVGQIIGTIAWFQESRVTMTLMRLQYHLRNEGNILRAILKSVSDRERANLDERYRNAKRTRRWMTRNNKAFNAMIKRQIDEESAKLAREKAIRESSGNFLSLPEDRYRDGFPAIFQDATDSAILNEDRDIEKIHADINDRDVLEYYQFSFRKLKTGIERAVCKEVLSEKILGKSLVALNSDIADILGIPLLGEVEARGGMGAFCRHSTRSLSNRFLKKLNSFIKALKTE
jgi:hypothetical protein